MRAALRSPILGLAFAAQSLCAAETNAQPTPAPAPWCFRGRPRPQCGSFWITEAGYYRQLAGTEVSRTYGDVEIPGPALDSHVSWELGGMVNRGRTEAFGGTLLVGVDDAGPRFALKARYRRWLGRGAGSLDFSGGPARATARVPYPGSAGFTARAYGVTGEIALDWHDWAAITVRGDVMRAGDRTVGAVYGGARVGSYPALGVTAAAALYVALIAAALSGLGF